MASKDLHREEEEEEEYVLIYQLLSKFAITPKQHHKSDAGYDLFSAENATILPSSNKLIKTDIAIELPKGMYGRIAERSSLALKNMISIHGGVIDNGYRGNIGVIMFNQGSEPYNVKQGSRIAQLIIQKYCAPKIKETKYLNESERGSNAFGSSGE